MPDRGNNPGCAVPVCLASASPVRARLLTQAGVEFIIDPADIDEAEVKARHAGGDGPGTLAAELAELKALKVSSRHPDRFVIGADQTLVCDGVQFNKPPNLDAARTTLLRLRGRRHTLTSAVCVVRGGKSIWRYQAGAVMEMRSFTDRFLETYLNAASDGVFASVGGYRLEGLGIQLFSAVEGDYFTVLGLPLLPMLGFFREQGVLTA